MTSAVPATPVADHIDRLAGLATGSALHALRHQRDKVASATQGSDDALFDPALAGMSLSERLLVALYACRLTPAPELAAHYRERLLAEGADHGLVAAVATGMAETVDDPRLGAMLSFTRTLVTRPIDGDRAALQTLLAAGITTPAIVTLAQLIAFLSYQTRLVAGLRAMRSEDGLGAASKAEPARPAVARPVPDSHGFTMQTLGWKAWLDVVDLGTATAQQIAVLEESHPQAKVSEYYRLLVHQPEILRQRSAAFNAIMYAPAGMARAERELGATVVSRINGCVYCASVHAQRFEQLVKRKDVILQVFDDPRSAGMTGRERALARFAIELTEAPGEVGAASIHELRRVGFNPLEILDLIHSVAIFAWANRLMLNLGEPVWPALAAA